MRIDGMHNFTNVLGSAMQATVVRDNVISNNIANVDTPGFKRSVVRFEDMLADAVQNFRRTGALDLSTLRPQIHREYDFLNYRIDENNVDIEFEMVQLYQNSMRFDVLSGGIIHHYRLINMAIAAM
ncbi:MAG: flagellar basal body rod protein FlgB [Defluviitaleaceae bacterium]|nr:flagellar basal body rod protein FlgB [Defluviitaleaceae bacterium]